MSFLYCNPITIKIVRRKEVAATSMNTNIVFHLVCDSFALLKAAATGICENK